MIKNLHGLGLKLEILLRVEGFLINGFERICNFIKSSNKSLIKHLYFKVVVVHKRRKGLPTRRWT